MVPGSMSSKPTACRSWSGRRWSFPKATGPPIWTRTEASVHLPVEPVDASVLGEEGAVDATALVVPAQVHAAVVGLPVLALPGDKDGPVVHLELRHAVLALHGPVVAAPFPDRNLEDLGHILEVPLDQGADVGQGELGVP